MRPCTLRPNFSSAIIADRPCKNTGTPPTQARFPAGSHMLLRYHERTAGTATCLSQKAFNELNLKALLLKGMDFEFL
jgi:hypothetical protein